MNGEPDPGTEAGDFWDILSTPIEGELPLVVGGHAVHLWALAYSDQLGPELERWFPLMSKDLDLYGSAALLQGLKEKFGGEYRLSGPRGPVIGQLVLKRNGAERKIDVLRNVVGIAPQDLVTGVLIEFEANGEWLTCRVAPLLLLFQGKVANLATLNQNGRNDRKHVEILVSVVRVYLASLISATEANELPARATVNALMQVLKITKSPEASKCLKEFGINFPAIWPRKELADAKVAPLGKFVEHQLSEESHA